MASFQNDPEIIAHYSLFTHFIYCSFLFTDSDKGHVQGRDSQTCGFSTPLLPQNLLSISKNMCYFFFLLLLIILESKTRKKVLKYLKITIITCQHILEKKIIILLQNRTITRCYPMFWVFLCTLSQILPHKHTHLHSIRKLSPFLINYNVLRKTSNFFYPQEKYHIAFNTRERCLNLSRIESKYTASASLASQGSHVGLSSQVNLKSLPLPQQLSYLTLCSFIHVSELFAAGLLCNGKNFLQSDFSLIRFCLFYFMLFPQIMPDI